MMKIELRRVGEIEISYVDIGEGPAVVLIHGHPFDATMWNPQVELLSKSYRVIVPELRGYGRTTKPPKVRETRFDLFASDILSLLDTLYVDTFVLGGLSMGGQVVLEIFRQAKHRVHALILADTFAGLDREDVRELRFVTADRIEREGMNAYAEEILLKMITPENAKSSPQLAAHVNEMMRATSPAGAAAALRGRANRFDYIPLLDLISVPTLVVVGRHDSYTPVSVAQQLHERIRHSSLRIIEDAGHMPNLERPKQFNEILVHFLKGLDDVQR
jgi:pimeloyl-ACP methyl ester carboxylesterase